MTSTEERHVLPEPKSLIGTWRRFGVVGPVYEVVGVDGQSPEGECMMRVRVVDSGEEVAYKLTDLMADPTEA